MKRFRVRFDVDAEGDLVRLYEFLLDRDPAAAESAWSALRAGLEVLAFSPFTCRKVLQDNPFLRELVIPFGSSGYVALIEIDDDRTVTVLAVRHQRESDYH